MPGLAEDLGKDDKRPLRAAEGVISMREATPSPTTANTPGEELHPRRWMGLRGVRWGLSLGSLVVLLVVLAQWARSLYSDAHSIAGRYDFSTYYAAAYALRHNLHANIYSQAVLSQAGAAGQVMVQPPLAYTYPPLFALLLSPFTLLSFRVLSKLWLFGNAALWLGITVVLAREIGLLLRPVLALRQVSVTRVTPGARVRGLLEDPLALVALALAAWLSLTYVPAAQTLLTGQINFLVLVPLALVPLLLRGGHERWAGAAVAVAAILKFTPAVLIVYLLLRRRWEAAAAALAVLVGLFVLSALAVGPGVAAASIGQALHVGTGDAGLGHNQALFAPLLLFVSLHAPGQLAAVTLLARGALVLLAVALGVVIWRLPVGSRHVPVRMDTEMGQSFTASDAATYGLALCGLLLLSPTAWVHHYVWVLPAAAIALGLAVAQLAGAAGTRRLMGAAARLALVVLACASLGVSLPYDWDTNPQPAITHAGLLSWPLALLLRPLATLLLACLLVVLARLSTGTAAGRS